MQKSFFKKQGAIGFLGLIISMHATLALANMPPDVGAGFDQPNIGTTYEAFLTGNISDDSTPVEQLVITWSQVSGPAASQIKNSSASITTVSFTAAGVYNFQLKASDGTLFSVDTVKITVHTTVPFKINKPADGERIEIGKSYTIHWQMDIPAGCEVEYSLTGGKSWSRITKTSVLDSVVWDIGTNYLDSTREGILKVQLYQAPTNVQTNFILVNPAVAEKKKSGCGSGAALALIIPLWLRAKSYERKKKLAQRVNKKA